MQKDDKLFYTIHGTLKEDVKFDEVLSDYFRLNLSLKENLENWSKVDSHFENYNKLGAVRILNQDVIENLFSFICSSNNNISRYSRTLNLFLRNIRMTRYG
jgi:N-glycosylase/DNA lyase